MEAATVSRVGSSSLQGTVHLVTGSASGIGLTTATRLAEEGATVYGADVRYDVEADSAAGLFHRARLDVRDATGWDELVTRILDTHGRLDGLCNIAGIVNRMSADTVTELTDDAWEKVLGTNLKGTWLGMRAVIPSMRSGGGGRIVNIASMAAQVGIRGVASYAASKGGVLALTRQVALDYGADGILVNAICPGTIDTPIFGDAPAGAKREHARSHILDRLGTADEVASMVCYLLREGGFITGAALTVDGGWSAKGSR